MFYNKRFKDLEKRLSILENALKRQGKMSDKDEIRKQKAREAAKRWYQKEKKRKYARMYYQTKIRPAKFLNNVVDEQ
ncbi:MAG TPA: hypothetical protein VEA59_00350 [Patescibacteria group bacterium]|nr:hypothetical protein [Patescibacteria group bacterium]